jgi:hypothetical protein
MGPRVFTQAAPLEGGRKALARFLLPGRVRLVRGSTFKKRTTSCSTWEVASVANLATLPYEQALASGKQLLVFVMDKDAPITVEMVDTDPDAYAKLLAFRSRVLTRHLCRMFTTREDLVNKAEAALRSARAN